MRIVSAPAGSAVILLAVAAQSISVEASAASPPSGTYEVVSVRRASDVAGGPNDPALDAEPGDAVSFDSTLVWWNGKTCKDWSVETDDEITPIVDDPILSDTQIGPLDSPSSTGDRVRNEGLWINCEGGPIAEIVVVDDRIIVAETPSSMSYVILERPLQATDILGFQKGLATMKFLDGTPGDTWSEPALRAVAAYAEYRGAKYRFERTAISGNLLDGLPLRANEGRPKLVKVVYADGVSAWFYGTEPGLQFAETLAFRFPGETREQRFQPTGELQPWEWQFDIFSPDESNVILLQDRFGPYHVVRVDNLPGYLDGAKGPDHVIGHVPGENDVAAVHHDARWVSDTSVVYQTTCCGETSEHRWDMKPSD